MENPQTVEITDLARDRAIRRIAKQVRRFPDLDLQPMALDDLSTRDAAFAHALEEIVLRRWLTIEFLLSSGASRPLDEIEPRVRAALMAGAAQLLFMDRVPDHAAINETVEWAKRAVRPGAGGFVNSILRRVSEMRADEPQRESWTDRRDELPLEDGGALALAGEILPEDSKQRLSIATSNPTSLLDLWERSMTLRDVRKLATHGLARPPIILNTAHLQRPLEPEALESRVLIPHAAPGHHVFTGDRAGLIQLLDERDDLWVQDPASSLAAMSVVDLEPELVIDACAGRGTKTRQLASAFPEARIVATDIDPARQRDLASVFESHPQVEVILFRHLDEWAGQADLILLDVPCSNTGVLARRVEARYRASEESTKGLVELQRQIVANSMRLTAGPAGSRRGRILYSTCSLDARENEEQAAWAARWHDLQLERENRRLPEGGPGQAPENYSDGAYAVLLA